MKKASILKKKKWLKARIRVKRLKKQNNYVSKTHKGADAFDLQQNLVKQAEDKERENRKFELLSNITGSITKGGKQRWQ